MSFYSTPKIQYEKLPFNPQQPPPIISIINSLYTEAILCSLSSMHSDIAKRETVWQVFSPCSTRERKTQDRSSASKAEGKPG